MENRNERITKEDEQLSDEWLLAFFEEESEKGRNEPEPEITTQERIYSYPDGTVYMGHMRICHQKDNVSYKRHGSGTLRTPAFVYGTYLNRDEAEENAHLAKWHEYIGNWKNDKLHGYGVHLQKSGDGSEIVIFEGIWENGKPKKSVHSKDADGDYDFDETVFGW